MGGGVGGKEVRDVAGLERLRPGMNIEVLSWSSCPGGSVRCMCDTCALVYTRCW